MNRNRKEKHSRFLHRTLKRTLGISLASMLFLGGFGSDLKLVLPEVSAAVTENAKEKSTVVYLDGAKGSKKGTGASKDTAVSSFSKAVSLAGDNGTILVCGTVTVSSDTRIDMPSGITVKRADGFKDAIIKVQGKGKVTLTYEWLKSSDVDTKKADLGEKAFVIEAKEEQKSDKEEQKEDEKKENSGEENGKDDGSEEETPIRKSPGEVVIPDSITMEEAAPLKTISMDEGFKGDGTFRFADSDTVPSEYEGSYQVIFTPDDTEAYDYSGVSGWSEEGQEVVRYITVYVESLKEPVVTEKEDTDKEDNSKPAEEESETEEKAQEKDTTDEKDTDKPNTEEKENDEKESSDSKDDTEKASDSKGEKDGAGTADDKIKEEEKADNKTDKTEESVNKEENNKTDTSGETDTAEEKEPVGSLTDKKTGVKVSGDFIPSYVDLRVTVNTDLDALPKADVQDILEAYQIELWDLKHDVKYEIPEGKKVKVMIPVPEGAKLYDTVVIAHYMQDKGEYEYFVPKQNLTIEDGYLIFETASFSPFNVGGNQIVGIGTVSQNHKPSTGSGTSITTGNNSSSTNGNKNNNASAVTKKPVVSNQKSTGTGLRIINPRTGDEMPVLKYVLIGAAAVVVILVLVVLGKRRKK